MPFFSNEFDIFYGFVSIMLGFFYVLFLAELSKLLIFSHVPYYHRVQYTIRHDLSSQIKYFKEQTQL
jgi:hypothetical protein